MIRNENCYIILSHIEGRLEEIAVPEEGSFVICADGGYEKAVSAGIKPDIIIGDLDSYSGDELPEDIPLKKLPVEKDVTDTDSCLEYAIDQGFVSIFIIGGLGGRCDHSIANIQNIVRYSQFSEKLGCAPKIIMADKYNYLLALTDDSVQLPRLDGYKVSLLSFTEKCEGVTVTGVHYPLEDYTLTNTFPLGVSNEFEDDVMTLEVRKGTLLVIMSKDV